MKNRSRDTIIEQLLNLKDDEGVKIIKDYIYEYIIKNNTKKKEQLCLL